MTWDKTGCRLVGRLYGRVLCNMEALLRHPIPPLDTLSAGLVNPSQINWPLSPSVGLGVNPTGVSHVSPTFNRVGRPHGDVPLISDPIEVNFQKSVPSSRSRHR